MLYLLKVYQAPISCAELSKVSGLKMMQVEHALKILRVQGQIDYNISRFNQRLWHLVVLEQKVFDWP